MVTVAPYGSWESPVSLEMLAEDTVVIAAPQVVDGDVYWTERRPAEGGRTAIVRRTEAGIEEVTPPDFNARTRIHEYGGVPYLAGTDEVLAVRFEDQRIYRIAGGSAAPLTPEPVIDAGERFGDLVRHGDAIIAVRERHRSDGEPVNELVAVPASGGTPAIITGGHDFYSSPRISPDGSQLAWLTWDHPRMPWDGTELWVARLDNEGTLATPQRVAGGPTESIFQPEWGPDGVLYWASDGSGWWNLVRDDAAIAPIEAEIGTAQWVFGMARYAVLDDGRIATVVTADGRQRIALVTGSQYHSIEFAHDTVAPYLAVDGTTLWCVAGDAATPMGLVGVDVDSGQVDVVRHNFTTSIDPAYFSMPEAIEAPTTGGGITHAFYYPPANPEFVAPEGELPPLIVMSHGGPTAATTTDLDLAIQFWTTRGFAVVDVNYRGSIGYGREYRAALEGQWGIVDTDDCIAAARHLADIEQVDARRMAIRGGSAGGYTTLCALAFHDVFAAGASYFGVADCAALAEHTHKFESRYLDSMIGPYPQAADLYRARSPLHHAEGISCPVLLLQGADDKVVLPEQAEVMVQALSRRGIPHAYILFAGEGHGFRKAENIIAANGAELSFYGQVFGFAPAGDVPRIALVPTPG